MAWLLFACSATSPLVTADTTDGGTWTLSLDQDEYATGFAELGVHAVRVDDGTPAEGLYVRIQPSMADMTHAVGAAALVEADPGLYGGQVVFDMAGLWSLDGTADDGTTRESFAFAVDAR